MVYYDYFLDDSSVHSSITVEKVKEEDIVTRKSACPCLRFSLEDNMMKTIENIEDYSDEEKEAAFYPSTELRRMKQEVRIVARWLADNDLDSTGEPDFSMRGMETMVYSNCHRTKKSSRRLAAAAVFMEQEMQQSEGSPDADAIAEEYLKVTAACQERAATMGSMDTMDALR